MSNENINTEIKKPKIMEEETDSECEDEYRTTYYDPYARNDDEQAVISHLKKQLGTTQSESEKKNILREISQLENNRERLYSFAQFAECHEKQEQKLRFDQLVEVMKSPSIGYEVFRLCVIPYYDYETKHESLDNIETIRLEELKTAYELIQTEYPKGEILILDACGPVDNPEFKYKISFHFLVRKCGYYANGKCVPPIRAHGFDQGVYRNENKRQLFRLPYCSKDGKTRFLKVCDEHGRTKELDEVNLKDLERYLVSNIRDEQLCYHFDDDGISESDDSEDEDNPKPKKETTWNEYMVKELLNCFEKQELEWQEWCDVIWAISGACAKLNIPYKEALYEFSKRSSKYDPVQTTHVIENAKTEGKTKGFGTVFQMLREKFPEQLKRWSMKHTIIDGIRRKDPYCWCHFRQEFEHKVFETKEEMIMLIKRKISRVLVFIALGEGFYLKKDNVSNELYSQIKTLKFTPNDFTLSYKEEVENKKATREAQKLSKDKAKRREKMRKEREKKKKQDQKDRDKKKKQEEKEREKEIKKIVKGLKNVPIDRDDSDSDYTFASKLYDKKQAKKDKPTEESNGEEEDEEDSDDEYEEEVDPIVQSVEKKIHISSLLEFVPRYAYVADDPNDTTPEAYHLSTEIAADRLENYDVSKIQGFLDFIKETICSSDEITYKFVLDWLAWIFQNPKLKVGVLLCLVGRQGTGKGSFVRFLSMIIGSAPFLQVNGIAPLMQKFNEDLVGKSFIYIDEARGDMTQNDFNNEFTALKFKITEPIKRIEGKGKKAYPCYCNTAYILSSNWATCLRLDDDDRRYTVIQMLTKERKNGEYWSNFNKTYYTKECTDIFYSYLLDRDMTGIKNMNDHIPKTKLRDDIIRLSQPKPKQFLDDWVETLFTNNNRSKKHIDMERKRTYEEYVAWCKESGTNNVLGRNVFYTEFEKWCDPVRDSKARKFRIINPDPVDLTQEPEEETDNDTDEDD